MALVKASKRKKKESGPLCLICGVRLVIDKKKMKSEKKIKLEEVNVSTGAGSRHKVVDVCNSCRTEEKMHVAVLEQASTPYNAEGSFGPSGDLMFLRQLTPPMHSSFSTDVVIHTKNSKAIFAHEFIVSGKSPRLRSLMKKRPGNQNIWHINVLSADPEIVRAAVGFMYTCEINFDGQDSKLGYLYEFARDYEIDWLKITCERKLATSITSVNLIERMKFANFYGAKLLKLRAKEFSKNHPELLDGLLDLIS